MSFFESKRFGDLVRRIEDHGVLEKFITNELINIIYSVLTIGAFGIILFIYDIHIFWLFLLGCIIYTSWILLFLQKTKLLKYELFEKQATNSSCTYELLSSLQEIKLQGCEQRRRWLWEDSQADIFDIEIRNLKIQQLRTAGAALISQIFDISITIVAALSVIKSEMTLGMMLAIQYIIGQLISPIEQLMNFTYKIQDVKISIERISEIYNMDDENSKSYQPDVLFQEAKYIKLKNVTFSYDKSDDLKTINNVSFNIPKGKITAIVGTSGSGKSTLLKLLLGYYPLKSGSILIDEQNLSSLNKNWWHQQCGVVMQEGKIFSDTIERNISLENNEIDKETLDNAVTLACIKDFIEELPLGYKTKIGSDGMNLSLGQRQRILIARAVYKKPSFIFMDEATNSLDAKNEHDIVKNLNDFYKDKTVLVIAHRLSTVRNADQIIVLDKGKVVEIGNHYSLIQKEGPYFNLVKNQLEINQK